LPTQINLQRPEDASAEATPATLRLRRERPAAGRAPSIRPPATWYSSVKTAGDFALALVLTVVALPVMGACALAVKLSSRGPAFYTQTRVGLGGKLFTIYKLRTMIHNCESLTGPRWCVPGDPRVTRLGWFLRVSHLDELPQLLNVLRGEMSLVGPRPERPEFLPELERSLPAYRQRLLVRPGVTGLAQVKLPPDTDIDSVRRKLAHDLYYVERLSLWLDLRLLAGTAFYAAGVNPQLTGRLIGVPDSAAIERAMHAHVGDPIGARRMSA
jgi:lipopolysaccharide/colanic/teichoic acid biosynthesis glycosyltransferase